MQFGTTLRESLDYPKDKQLLFSNQHQFLSVCFNLPQQNKPLHPYELLSGQPSLDNS